MSLPEFKRCDPLPLARCEHGALLRLTDAGPGSSACITCAPCRCGLLAAGDCPAFCGWRKLAERAPKDRR